MLKKLQKVSTKKLLTRKRRYFMGFHVLVLHAKALGQTDILGLTFYIFCVLISKINLYEGKNFGPY
jgi:hypothetical protein